jgi:hypothetical protein
MDTHIHMTQPGSCVKSILPLGLKFDIKYDAEATVEKPYPDGLQLPTNRINATVQFHDWDKGIAGLPV